VKRALLSIVVLAALAVAAFVVLRSPEPQTTDEPEVAALPEAEPEHAPDPPGLELEPAAPTDETPAREEIASAAAESGTSVPTPPPNAAPVRGRLTDKLTGEPLPYFALQIRDASGPAQEVSTDADGRFATAASLASGALRIRYLDSRSNANKTVPEDVRERAVEDGAAPDLDLSIASGPTYHLAITPVDPVPAKQLLASLRVANLDARGKLDATPLRVGLGTGPIGEAPWVRFGPTPEQFDRAESIEVESQDGLWFGSAKARAIRGDVQELVNLRLEARGVLQGKVVEPTGKPVAGARVRFDGTTSGGKPLNASGRTEIDGSFSFPLLAEGSGALAVRSLRHLPKDATVSVVPGNRTIQDFVLEPIAAAGSIHGRVESRTGAYDARVEIALTPLESPALAPGSEPPPRQTSPVSWSTVDGRRVGAFAFEDLPAGRYEIVVRDKGYLRWDPDRATVSPPSAETSILVLDDQPNADFVFRVRDADSGAELTGGQVSLQVRGGSPPWTRLRPDAPVLARYPTDRPFRWRLDLEGYRTATGDEKAFTIEETKDGRTRRIAEIDLLRGWGEVFRVAAKARNRPIAGATIVLDGKDAGTTGNDGFVLVTSPEKPERVDVRYKDWVLADPLDLRAPWMRRQKWFVNASLAPPPGH
jgi:hypothetical protein